MTKARPKIDVIAITKPRSKLVKRRFDPKTGRQVIPIETMVALGNSNMKYEDIAEFVGCSVQHVKDQMCRVNSELKSLKGFRKTKSDLLALKERDLLGAMGPEKMEKAGIRDLAIAYNIVHTAGRLEDNKSTANIATYAKILKDESDGTSAISRKEAELQRLLAENPDYIDAEFE